MIALKMAQDGYARAATPLKSDRSIEYEVIARITHQLKATNAQKSKNFPLFAKAVHDNRRLWTALAADAASQENMLPAALKAQVIYLAEFTQAHSAKVLRGQADIAPLLDVNIAVLKGLKMQEIRE